MKSFINLTAITVSVMAFIVSAITLSGCCDRRTVPHIVKYSHIERVFMHDPGQYSFLYRDESSNQLLSVSGKIFGSDTYRAKSFLVADVKKEDFCWAEVDMNNYTITIHIHNASEISGGGWNHGKFGSGSTSPVDGFSTNDATMPTMPSGD